MRSTVLQLLSAIILYVIGITVLVWGIPLLFPGISASLLQSRLLIFGMAVLILTIWIAVWMYQRLLRRTRQEIAKRKRSESELSQLNQEFEELIREKTFELARVNLDLDLEIAQHKQAEETALANEERFRNMADNIEEGLTIIEDGRVVYINQSACKIFGRCLDDQTASSNEMNFIIPEESWRFVMDDHGQQNGHFPKEVEYWITRQDGARRCIHDRYSYSKTRGIARYFIVTSDITEQVLSYQMLEQAVEERTRELSAVLEVSKKINSMLELEPLLQVILEQIRSIIPYSGVAIFTLHDTYLEVIAYQSPGLPEQVYPLHLTLSNAGIYQEVIQQRSVLVLDDVNGDTPLSRALVETSEGSVKESSYHTHSWIGVPLVIKDRVFGLLSLTHEKPGFYTQIHARLAHAIANQVAIAMENARLYKQAHDLATLQERQRIAGELHDSVTQLLYGICLYSAVASRAAREGNFESSEQNLNEIKENALQALREMRLLIYELNPPMLADAGLVAALQTCLDSVKVRTGLQTELRAENIDRLPSSIESELYRVALEALNNMVKYARAKKVSIDLRLAGETVYLQISDDGIGFDLTSAMTSGGLGLQNMERRVKQMGGSLEIRSAPGSGTRIMVEVRIWETAKLRAEIVSNAEV